MQHVYTARDGMEAHFVQGLLQQEGIESVIQGEALAEVWGGVPLTGKAEPTVWVRDEDAARAAPVIDEYRRREAAHSETSDDDVDRPRPTWTCPNCGETVEEQFTACWNCGTPRPAGGESGRPPSSG